MLFRSLVQPMKRPDDRGYFVKTFHAPEFETASLETNFTEEYYSWSHKGMIRGLHFQTPPHEHSKLVYCPIGEVLDVILDLRIGSPMFSKAVSFTLSETLTNVLYVPAGIAHGFAVQSSNALMMYKVSSVYSPQNDSGILWDSVGLDWGIKIPIVSSRDRSFRTFQDFQSSFQYDWSSN